MKKEDIRANNNLVNPINGTKVKVLFVGQNTVLVSRLDGSGFPTPDEFCIVWERWEKVCDHVFDISPLGSVRRLSWRSVVGAAFCPLCGERILNV